MKIVYIWRAFCVAIGYKATGVNWGEVEEQSGSHDGVVL